MMVNLIDLIGRLLISALFLISAYNKIFSIDGSMSWMEGFGVPGFLLYPTIALEIILPLFIIIGYQARISAGLLAFFCVATAFVFHYDFGNQIQTIAFLKNIGLAGGFLFIVANGTKDWSIETKKKYVRL
jgi:putative oxidoreductase